MPDLVWKPNPRQKDFLSIPDSVFEAFYGGAAYGGKSELLYMIPIVRRFIEHPLFQGVIFRRTYPELEQSIIERAKPIYKLFGAKYNESKHTFVFPSGAQVLCRYLEKDSDARSHDTSQYNYIAFDELSHFSEFQYLYLTGRCRTRTKDLPKIIRSASNPGNIGHTWVRSRFVEPCRTGYKLLRDTKSKQLRIFIPAKLEDNIEGLKEDPDYGERLKLLPEAEYKAKAEGDWWAYSGTVFTEFRAQKYSSEPDHAIHVIEPFEIPKWWPKIIAIDWGYDAYTWVGWGAVSPDGRLYVYRELFVRKTYIADWGSTVAAWSVRDENIVAVKLDPSAWSSRGDQKTIAEQFEDASGFQPEKADNDRIGGKLLIHELLRWKPKVKAKVPKENFDQEFADKLFRMKGMDAYYTYLEAFEEEKPETNLPKLQIFKTCTALIEALQVAEYDEDNKEKKHKSEDVMEYKGDDPYDGCRYLVKAYQSYVEECTEEFEKVKRLQDVLQQKERDMTSFMIQMQIMEVENNPKSIKLYH